MADGRADIVGHVQSYVGTQARKPDPAASPCVQVRRRQERRKQLRAEFQRKVDAHEGALTAQDMARIKGMAEALRKAELRTLNRERMKARPWPACPACSTCVYLGSIRDAAMSTECLAGSVDMHAIATCVRAACMHASIKLACTGSAACGGDTPRAHFQSIAPLAGQVARRG